MTEMTENNMNRLESQVKNDLFESGPETVRFVTEECEWWSLPVDKDIKVLDPCAGTGKLADIFDNVEEWDIYPQRPNQRKRDMLEYAKKPNHKHYDRIVMNPPWSKRQYFRFICAGYELLDMLGEMIVICPRWHRDQPKYKLKPGSVVYHWTDFPVKYVKEYGLTDEYGHDFGQVQYLGDVNDFNRVDAKLRSKPFKMNACVYRFIKY